MKNKRGTLLTVLIIIAISYYFLPGSSFLPNIELSSMFNPVKGEVSELWKEGKNIDSPKIRARKPRSFADLAEKDKKAVVNIYTTKLIKRRGGGFGPDSPFGGRNPFEDFFGRDFFRNRPREFTQKSLGSGFIINKEGYIVTNNHVIDQAQDIRVKLSDGKEYKAKVIGKDKKTDLALIKIDAAKKLPTVMLGDSDNLRIGEWVMAVGNPFGLEQTVTVGVVSGKGRVLGVGDYDDLIQTDASINPGNSGGPLFDLNGEVVGINSAIIAQAQGIGLAIPINQAKEILPQLKEKGKVTRGWIGVAVQDLNEDLVNSFGLKSTEGALVSQVVKDSPAYKANIKRGDVIVKFKNKKVENSHELSRRAASTKPGTVVPVTIVREGKEKIIELTLEEYPDEEISFEEGGKAEDKLGIRVEDLTPEIADRLGAGDASGVVVTNVKGGEPADRAGVRRGDIIKEVNRKEIDSVSDYKEEMGKANIKEGILFLIQRGNMTLFISVKGE